MTTAQTCGACGMTIETCPTCGGLLCMEGCVDRAEDGCTCVAMDKEDDDVILLS